MRNLPETTLDRSKQLPEGDVLVPKELLYLCGRAAVDQAFSRVARAGLLMRIARGMNVCGSSDEQVRSAAADGR